VVVLTASPNVSLRVLAKNKSRSLFSADAKLKTLLLHTRTSPAKASGVFFRLKFARYLLLGAVSLVFCASVLAKCPAQQIDERAKVEHIYDGDTLRLNDGRRVRVLGINAPETGDKKRVAQPLATAAKQAAEQFFKADKEVRLQFDQERHDKYGRILAHIYDSNGRSLAAHLLQQGLAFHVVVPPNTSAANCLREQEQKARKLGLGIWGDSSWRSRNASSLRLADTGYQRVKGKVVKITEGRDIWIELDGPVVLKIAARDKRYFDSMPWRDWKGRTLDVSGWVINRSNSTGNQKNFKPLVLPLRTAYAVSLQ
jgi:micrococcal nuclease